MAEIMLLLMGMHSVSNLYGRLTRRLLVIRRFMSGC